MKKEESKEKKSDMVSCPNCNGFGEIPGQRGNHPSIMITRTRMCSVCGGKGEITRKLAIEFNDDKIESLLNKKITLN